ncbi:MAG: sulfatase [Candidatus Melainabacteria bacterium]|nr:sulfatase [Candidatus Melainabacteria bacterium]
MKSKKTNRQGSRGLFSVNKLTISILFIAIIFGFSIFKFTHHTNNKPNVLFIIVDDLRPELGCYGKTHVKTPNIDKLASKGLLFTHAYSQASSCFPARQALILGRRPEPQYFTRFYKEYCPKCISLPLHLKKNGYHTVSIGKVFHIQDENFWSEKELIPQSTYAPEYHTEKNLSYQTMLSEALDYSVTNDLWWTRKNRWFPASLWEAPELDDLSFFDGRTVAKAIEYLSKFKEQKTPFFLAIGFYKPHLPFVAPKKYFDLYPLSDISLTGLTKFPKNSPRYTVDARFEWQNYEKITTEDLLANPMKQKEFLRGYYACVSFIDAQVGKLIDSLEKLGLSENTIVIFIGDQGYHLSENEIFGKHTNFEAALKVPAIISYPDKIQAGQRTNSIIELIDIYPTLCEFLKLPIPRNVQGQSFKNILQDPLYEGKDFAVGVYPRGNFAGKTIRVPGFRYTRWENIHNGKTIEELYEYGKEEIEIENVALDPKYKNIKEKLSSKLKSN